jgi:transcription initiation factor TFIID TATA-box-binding protein
MPTRNSPPPSNPTDEAGPVTPPETVADIVARLTAQGYPTDVKVSNIVLTCNLNCMLDVSHIANNARNIEYNTKRFSGAIMRIRSPRATAMFWQSGKLVCVGARTMADARLAVRKVARVIQRLGFCVRPGEPSVQNMVASIATGACVHLEGIAAAHGRVASYEPEIFAGMTYRIHSLRVTLVIFTNGKVVFTGAKREEDIWRAWELVYPVVRQHVKL